METATTGALVAAAGAMAAGMGISSRPAVAMVMVAAWLANAVCPEPAGARLHACMGPGGSVAQTRPLARFLISLFALMCMVSSKGDCAVDFVRAFLHADLIACALFDAATSRWPSAAAAAVLSVTLGSHMPECADVCAGELLLGRPAAGTHAFAPAYANVWWLAAHTLWSAAQAVAYADAPEWAMAAGAPLVAAALRGVAPGVSAVEWGWPAARVLSTVIAELSALTVGIEPPARPGEELFGWCHFMTVSLLCIPTAHNPNCELLTAVAPIA